MAKKFGGNRILPSSGLLRGVRWFESDVSGLHIGSIFEGQAESRNVGFKAAYAE